MRISRSTSGKIKIVCQDAGTNFIVLFEPLGKDALESRFDQEGGLINQRLIKGGNTEKAADTYLQSIGALSKLDEDYTPIKLEKSCPHCSVKPLSRYIDTLTDPKEAPVMPLYFCDSCKRRSYYLTDDYLRNLVVTNKQLFETAELTQMDKDEKAFIAELRAYIIRIFASKSISNIK